MSVGVGGLLGEDPEGDAALLPVIAAVNSKLRDLDLPEHHEKGEYAGGFDMYGYSGLHYLRRVAAHLWFEDVMPQPGDDEAIGAGQMEEDYCQRRGYYSRLGLTPQKATSLPPPRFGLFRRRKRAEDAAVQRPIVREPVGRLTFDHLMFHSDAEGYYFPQDFKEVMFFEAKVGDPGDTVGSSHRLMRECETIASALGLPLALDPESDELWAATEHQGKGGDGWRRYGIESFTCSRLYHAAKLSVEHRAILYFT